MDRKEFFDLCRPHYNRRELVKIRWAYDLSKEFHRPQLRKGGERYFEHPRAVALILLGHQPTSSEEIQMALLHDTIEDQFPSQDLLECLFGKNIVRGLNLLSKCRVVEDDTGKITKVEKSQEEYYYQLADAPHRVRRVKLADRIHNLRTLAAMPAEKQIAKIKETDTYIMPWAHTTDAVLASELIVAIISRTMGITVKR